VTPCRLGRPYDEKHRTCKSCLRVGAAVCRGRLQAQAKALPAKKDWPGALIGQLRLLGLPEPVREHRFHPTRRFRLDLAWPDRLLAVEVDGGLYLPGGGRHNRGPGMERDNEKKALATALGWRVIAVSTGQVRSGEAVGWIQEAMKC
jgi:very-short-patch-repair endonuclease